MIQINKKKKKKEKRKKEKRKKKKRKKASFLIIKSNVRSHYFATLVSLKK